MSQHASQRPCPTFSRTVAWRRWVVPMALAWAAASAAAQPPEPGPTEPCGELFCQTHSVPGPMGQPDPCAATWGLDASGEWGVFPGAPANARSMCWARLRAFVSTSSNGSEGHLAGFGDCGANSQVPGHGTLFLGANPKMDLFGLPGLGDFLPPAATLEESALPLVPRSAAMDATGWQGQVRPTLDGRIDLVTGMPLVREVDLELPVGGSVFRLVRTRTHSVVPGGRLGALGEPDSWWDWAGEGWTIGENPVLLVDSALPDVVGNLPATCYLLLDAFHSIPFQRIESSGLYEAPPRFRARLTHDGTWGVDANGQAGWLQRPTTFRATLFDGQVVYTFAPVWDDVPMHRWNLPTFVTAFRQFGDPALYEQGEPGTYTSVVSSLSQRPFLPTTGAENHNPRVALGSPGLGVPYRALCTRIEDAGGNRVEITYCGLRQHAIDHEASPCVECAQECGELGMIRHVVLRDSAGEARWTLVYAYRSAPGAHPFASPELADWIERIPSVEDVFGQRVIDAVYAYEGDVTALLSGNFDPCAARSSRAAQANTTHASRHAAVVQLADPMQSRADAVGGSFPAALLGWRHRVRHAYSYSPGRDSPAEVWNGATTDLYYHTIDARPNLIATVVTSRQAPGSEGTPGSEEERRSIYRYADETGVVDTATAWLSRLTHVVGPADFDRLLTALDGLGVASIEELDVASLALGEDASGTPLGAAVEQLVDSYAGWRLWTGDRSDASLHAEGERAAFVGNLNAGSGSRPYVSIPQDRNVMIQDREDSWVSRAALREPGGVTRYYRILRLMSTPQGLLLSNGFHVPPHRSVWHAPFEYFGYRVSVAGQLVDETQVQGGQGATADYDQPRWITVIDELMSRTSLDYLGGAPMTQLATGGGGVRTRRVVEVGGSGLVLRDRSWQIKPDGTVDFAGGAGLGEEFIYRSVGELVDEVACAPDRRALVTDVVFDQVRDVSQARARAEMLLLEHRTIGWSAADAAGQGQGEGLTRFWQYELLAYDPDPNSADPEHPERELDDAVYQTRVLASGIRRGRSYGDAQAVGGCLNEGAIYQTQTFHPPTPGQPDASGWERGCEVIFATEATARLATIPDVPTAGQGPIGDLHVTHTLLRRWEPHPGEDTPAAELPVKERLSIGVAQQVRPLGAWYYPVEMEWLSREGQAEWSASGLVRNPTAPSAADVEDGEQLQSLTVTRRLFDASGRVSLQVQDYSTQATSQPGRTIHDGYWVHPAAPGMLQSIDRPAAPVERIAHPSQPALNALTLFVYNMRGDQPSDVYQPNGRRTARRQVVIAKDETCPSSHSLRWNLGEPMPAGCERLGVPGGQSYAELEDLPVLSRRMRVYTFNDVVALDAGGGQTNWVSRTACEVSDMHGRHGTSPYLVGRVFFALPNTSTGKLESVVLNEFLDDPRPENQPSFVAEARVTLGVDGDGRLAEASLLERSASGAMLAVGTKRINDLVDVYREEEIDGSITRTTRNTLGQPVRRYVGTLDARWSTGQAEDPDDLVLSERTVHGTGAADVRLATEVWRYARVPDFAGDPYGTVSSDGAGLRTLRTYDWRRREVRVDEFDRVENGGQRLRTTVTWMDHLDRALLVAVFGRDGTVAWAGPTPGPTSVTQGDLDGAVGVIASCFAPGVAPLVSLERTYYGANGGVTQRRRYATGAGSDGSKFHAEHTLQGRGGIGVYSESAGEGATLTLLDGLGRSVRTDRRVRQGAAGDWYELSRTESVLDFEGNAVETLELDRVLGDAQAALDASASGNAVRSRRVAWFDERRRTIAHADLGTQNPLGYASGADVFQYVDAVTNPSGNWPRFAPTGMGLEGTGGLFAGTGNGPGYDVSFGVQEYDIVTGRPLRRREPSGLVVETTYDAAGREWKKAEYSPASPGQALRVIEHKYQWGRLSELRVQGAMTPGGAVGDRLMARVEWGADIVAETGGEEDPGYAIVSRSKSLVGKSYAAHDPGESEKEQYRYRYRIDGLLAERIDARGVSMRYYYDGLGRPREVVVGSYADPNDVESYTEKHPDLPPSAGDPVDRVGLVRYTYDARGRLGGVVAYTQREGSVVSRVGFEYDEFGNLAREVQGIGGYEDGDELATPNVEYEWDYVGSEGAWSPTADAARNRLAKIGYPLHEGQAARREVTLGYGAAGSVEDRLDRVTRLASGPLAIGRFAHTGQGRRSWLGVGPDGWQGVEAAFDTQAGTVGLEGLDPYGRVRDLHYRSLDGAGGSWMTLHRAQYEHDADGKRRSARITQVAWSSGNAENVRSQLNEYDGLGRLVGTRVGQLDGASPTGIAAGSQVREDLWRLDVVGNWIGATVDGVEAGRRSDGLLDGLGPTWMPTPAGGEMIGGTLVPWQHPAGDDSAPDSLSLTHVVDERNEIQTSSLQRDADPAVTSQVKHDAGGNVVFDGEYAFQYDAWNRLVQVNRAHLDVVQQLGNGEPSGQYQQVVLDEMVKHYTYDGLGRLIRTQSPYPDPQSSQGELRTERFYYDGVRRIQEVIIDPLESLELAQGSSQPEVQAAAVEAQMQAPIGTELDESAAPVVVESAQLEAGGGLGGSWPTGPRVEREYVWGPGDNGLDELLCQFDRDGTPWWVLQDAGGDVVALCETPHASAATVVAAQWTWDAYGNVISAEHLRPHAVLAVGHKGLFADRLDVGVAEAATPGQTISPTGPPRLAPWARVQWHNRNRTDDPSLGRYVQGDPNAAGQTLLASRHHGLPAIASVDGVELASRFGDGPGLQTYLGSSPWTSRDEMGLYTSQDFAEDLMDLAELRNPIPDAGSIAQSILREVVTEYSANLDWDVEWATDWSLPDDAHSRTSSAWVNHAIIRGFRDAFDISIPFTDLSVNPWDIVARERGGGSWGGNQYRIKLGRGRYGKFSKTIRVGGYTVNIFKHPNYRHRMVRFDRAAIKKTVRISPTGTSEGDIAAANRRAGKPARYDWSAEFGEPHTWHHDTIRGRMQLVPRALHFAALPHMGGMITWYR